MNTVGELLDKKGNKVLSITPDSMVYDAILKMAHYEIGALLVMDNENIVGIISERDYARKIILQNRSSKSTKVSEIMSSNVISADPGHSVEHCMSLMTEKRIRHLPVMAEGSIKGMVSIGDLVKEIISDQQSTIEFLETYIKA
jgi:CBS domain-containing protein